MMRTLITHIDVVALDEERIKYEAERGAFNMVGRAMQPVREYRG